MEAIQIEAIQICLLTHDDSIKGHQKDIYGFSYEVFAVVLSYMTPSRYNVSDG